MISSHNLAKISVYYSKPIEYFNDWKSNVLNKNNFEVCKSFEKRLFLTYKLQHLRSVIKEMENKFNITYAGKAADNYVAICKFYYKFPISDAIKSGKIKEKQMSCIAVKQKIDRFITNINSLKPKRTFLTIPTL